MMDNSNDRQQIINQSILTYYGSLYAEFQHFIDEMQSYKNEMSLQGELLPRPYGHKVVLWGFVKKSKTPFRFRMQIWTKSDVDVACLWFQIISQMCEVCIGRDFSSDSE